MIIQQVKQIYYDKGGRPPYDTISMFKAVLWGQWNSLSDDGIFFGGS
ncbi:MAG: transposase [Neisseriaceae bacterium]|nr:transposase [Neisseriaceae bacterium]